MPLPSIQTALRNTPKGLAVDPAWGRQLWTLLQSATGADSGRVAVCDSLGMLFLRATQASQQLDRELSNHCFQYVVDFVGGTGPLANSLAKLLQRLIGYARQCDAPAIGRWLGVVAALDPQAKTRYLLMEHLVKELKTAPPEFARQCIEGMRLQMVANQAARAFVAVFQHVPGNYWDELERGLADASLRDHMLVYLMPKVLNKEDFPRFLGRFSDMDIRLGLMKVGVELGFPADVPAELLVHPTPRVRLRALALLVGSKKKRQRVPPSVFEKLIDNNILDVFLCDSDDIETRNEFYSVFRQFLFRVRDSGSDQGFLAHVSAKVAALLRPNASYGQITQALRLMEAFPLDVPSELLLDNICSNYEDVRTAAAELLLRRTDKLSASAIKANVWPLLSDLRGRRSDGGARVLLVLVENDPTLAQPYIDELFNDLSRLHADIGPSQYTHGTFTALRYILKNRTTAHDIIGEARRAWLIVKPLLLTLDDDRAAYTFAWKVVKELTALVAEIIPTVADEAVLAAAHLLMDQLASVVHRGALSSIRPSFVRVCEECLGREPLAHYPQQWLEDIIALFDSKTQLILRRSGGVPFLVTGLLTAAPGLVDDAVTRLLEVSGRPYRSDGPERNDIPQVHGFNCLKQVFLELQPTKHTKDALVLALSNVSHETWAIRNCAVMLFTALQNRIFGSNRSGGTPASTAAKFFFARYPGVAELLESQLRQGVAGDVEAVFPVLTIISRLEGDLTQFEPLIEQCLSHSHWKVRELAARTIRKVPQTNLPNGLHGRALALRERKKVDHNLLLGDFTVLKPAVDALPTPVPEHILRVLGHRLIEGLANSSLHGPRTLALETITKVLLREYRGRPEYTDVALLALEGPAPVQLSAIEAVRGHMTPSIAARVGDLIQSDWIYLRAAALKAVKHQVPPGVVIKVDGPPEMRADALEAIAPSTTDHDAFVAAARELLGDDTPSDIQLTTTRALVTFARRTRSPHAMLLLHTALSVDDEECRLVAAHGLCTMFGVAPRVPSLVAQEFFTHFDDDAVVEHFLHLEPSVEARLAAFFSPNQVFEAESTNLYRDTVARTTQVAEAVKRRTLSPEQEAQIARQIDHENALISQHVGHLGPPGVLSWSREPLLFAAITEAGVRASCKK